MTENIEMAFLQDNARTDEEKNFIDNFIATDKFWELFSPKHQILLGSRGAGKTAITKMASFPFLRRYEHPEAEKIIGKLDYVGFFVNTDIRFVGSLKNKIWTEQILEEKYFLWKFNINCIKSILPTIDSLLQHIYGDTTEKILLEKKFVEIILLKIFGVQNSMRLSELPDFVSDYEFTSRNAINSRFLQKLDTSDLISDLFSTELLEPIQYTIRTLGRIVPRLAKTQWLLLVDEAEFLTEMHHRIINSFMRAHPDRIFIKMATLPYHHHTLNTNLNVHLQPDDDFEYIYLDANPIYDLNSRSRYIYSFARQLFKSRIINYLRDSNINLLPEQIRYLTDLDLVLGTSPFENYKRLPDDIEYAIKLLSPYLDDVTKHRAENLKHDKKKFGNEIWRKVSGIICLIEEKRNTTGNKQMSCYSGVETMIRCTDGVPRRMINLFQDIAHEIVKLQRYQVGREVAMPSIRNPILTGKAQTRILKSFSEKRFSQSISVPGVGPRLKSFVECIGDYISYQLHHEKISTDVIGSFRFDPDTCSDYWQMVKAGVAFGFIFPNVNDRQPDRLFEKKGAFRLSFSLCPRFNTFPRMGTARNLQGIIRARKRHVAEKHSNIPDAQEKFNF